MTITESSRADLEHRYMLGSGLVDASFNRSQSVAHHRCENIDCSLGSLAGQGGFSNAQKTLIININSVAVHLFGSDRHRSSVAINEGQGVKSFGE